MSYDPKVAYVGPNWAPECVRKYLSRDFNYAGYVHDMNYSQGVGRRFADRAFMAHMLAEAGSDPVKAQKAVIYYLGVRIGGWLSKKPRWIKKWL